MANGFYNWPFRDSAADRIKIANRFTDDFMLPFLATASANAESELEQRLAAWIGEGTQFRGLPGMAGFGLNDIPWSASDWMAQRDFLILALESMTTATPAWPLATLEPRRPREQVEEPFRTWCHTMAGWLRAWDEAAMAQWSAQPPSSPGRIGWLNPLTAGPRPWADVRVGLCQVHGAWTPVAPDTAPECVFCDLDARYRDEHR